MYKIKYDSISRQMIQPEKKSENEEHKKYI